MKIEQINTYLLISILAIFASGCSLIQQASYTPGTDAEIEKLLADQEYGKALVLLEQLKDTQSDTYTLRKKQLSSLVTEFEKNTIQEAGIYADKGEFHSAIQIINEGLKKIPESKELLNSHNNFILKRDQKLEESRINLLLVEAKYKLDRLKWYQEESRLKKSSMITSWQIKNMEGSLEHLRNKFLNCNTTQKAIGNSTLATKCLQMALKILPDKSLEESLSTSDKQAELEELNESKKTRPENISKEQDVESVINKVAHSEENNPDETLTDENSAESQIELLMNEGSDHYRAGRITEARESWQRVLEINSEHKAAKDQLARAEKVLNRLDSLKKTKPINDK